MIRENKQVDCQLGSVLHRLDGKKHGEKREGGGELREEDEKRKTGKKCHLFFVFFWGGGHKI